MHFCRRFVLVLFCSLLVSLNAVAQSAQTPAPGSEERKAIMDALRVPAKKDLGVTVVFKVDRLRVAGDWAFARVVPTLPDGGQVDYSKTRFKKQIDLGAFDPQGEALLRLEGGEWKVLEWVFGATDVPSAGWGGKYRLPASLLQ